MKKVTLLLLSLLVVLFELICFGSVNAGYVVIGTDDWIFTNTGFSSRPVDTSNFAINLAELFTSGTSGFIHAYSDYQSLTQYSLVSTLNSAGYTYTTGTNISFDLQTLSQFDALYIGGYGPTEAEFDILSDYMANGGSLYVHGGLGMSNPAGTAALWNDFLSQYDLAFGQSFISVGGATTIISSHSLFDGVSSLYMLNGHATYGDNVIAKTTSGTPIFAISQVPIPGAVWLLGSGLVGLIGLRRKTKN